MGSFFLFSYAFYLYYLLPIPTEHRSFKQALADSKEMAQAMVSKFEAYNEKPFVALVAFSLVTSVLIANFIFNFIQPEMLLVYFFGSYSFIEHSSQNANKNKVEVKSACKNKINKFIIHVMFTKML